MRRYPTRRAAVLGLCAAALTPLPFRALAADKDGGKTKAAKKAEVPLKVDETIGDLAKVPPMAEIKVEGVGLVIGLDGTGSDPAPSPYRQKLLDVMRKARVEHAEQYLASKTTSLVLIKGKIPAGITTEDVFDVEVELDPASTTTSLAGGQLMLADLFQVAFGSKGEVLPQGQRYATVFGPVMTGSGNAPESLKAGRVLGGARVKKDIPYVMLINEKRKSFKTAAIVQERINERFSRLKGIDQEGMAKAKTDEYLYLSIPRNYHHNQYRFFQVVENLPVVETPPLRAARIEHWGKDLLDPKTAGASAIRLEGLGRNACDVLKIGLANPHPQVRFFAAEALAYLGDDAGVDVLSDAAKNRPEFRAYALAALAAMDQPASSLRLKDLMAHADPEVRYGAFNALRIIDAGDPYLGQVQVRDDEPEEEPEGGDALAMRIASTRPRKKAKRREPFALYVVDCEGPPLIHLARTRRCEVVIFGKGQKLQTPAVLGVGTIQVNASDGDDRATVSQIGSESADGPDRKVATSLEVAAIVREAANLGATYPEILALLQAADRQRNLPIATTGKPTLVIDALPSVLPAYEEAQIAGKDATAKADPALERTSAKKAEKAPRKSVLGRVLRRGK